MKTSKKIIWNTYLSEAYQEWIIKESSLLFNVGRDKAKDVWIKPSHKFIKVSAILFFIIIIHMHVMPQQLLASFEKFKRLRFENDVDKCSKCCCVR